MTFQAQREGRRGEIGTFQAQREGGRGIIAVFSPIQGLEGGGGLGGRGWAGREG